MELPDSIRRFKESENFWISLSRDAFSVIAIVAIFALFSQIVFGLWTPMVAVESGSMKPNMNIGDIIFIQSIERTEVVPHDFATEDYTSFNMQGDVILYRPYGQEGVTPIIHRAMHFVEKGEPMWTDGPIAPHSGYVTKGDNKDTNKYYDQQGMVSYLTPVKEEWVIGVARYRIPYLGHVRLLLS